MGDDLLVYGSYGYTGSLIARTAVDEGLSPMLAGRRAGPVEEQALELGCDHEVFSLDHPEVVERRVGAVDAVLNCAGPFSTTADSLVEACLHEGTDYLDIAGAIDVLESIAERDRKAEKAGVTLLPGAGFDVVPTDCLAAYLHERLPSGNRLVIGLDGLGTFSPGTVKSIVEGFNRPGAVRQEGVIRTVPMAWKTRRLDFGQGPKPAVTVPWGDISTAYYSTGIPNVEVYAMVPGYALEVMRRMRPLVPLLGTEPVQWTLKRAADILVSGPTADERTRSVTRVWAEVSDNEGNRAAARMRTPDTYDVTARVAVEAARRTLSGEAAPGFHTPASAFGTEFATEFNGVEREDVEPSAVEVSEVQVHG